MEHLKRNILRTAPVMAGYLVLGIGFGIILQSRGYGVGWALAMSVFIYAGSMQYVAVDLLTAGAGLISTALTALLVNARHLFYGISMLERFRQSGRARPYLIFALTDETYSLLCGNGELDERDLLEITALDHCYWVCGSVAGSLIGHYIPWDFAGVDFALTALFVCIFTDQWLSGGSRLYAVTGVGSSLLCLALFGPDAFLLPSMGLITALLMVLRPRERRAGT